MVVEVMEVDREVVKVAHNQADMIELEEAMAVQEGENLMMLAVAMEVAVVVENLLIEIDQDDMKEQDHVVQDLEMDVLYVKDRVVK